MRSRSPLWSHEHSYPGMFDDVTRRQDEDSHSPSLLAFRRDRLVRKRRRLRLGSMVAIAWVLCIACHCYLGMIFWQNRIFTPSILTSSRTSPDTADIRRLLPRAPPQPPRRPLAQPNRENASTSFFLWKDPSLRIPTWMRDYMDWHHQKRLQMTPSNWNVSSSFRYLIMRCLARDDTCGGAADRLITVPLALQWAHRSHRLLLIDWERPAPLTEFLVPPTGGLDWRVPHWLHTHLIGSSSSSFRRIPLLKADVHMSRLLQPRYENNLVIDMRHQAGHWDYYNQNRYQNDSLDEYSLEELFHDAWSLLFQPSPPVKALLDEYLLTLGLTPGHYVGVHIRSLYKTNRTLQSDLVFNAIHCGRKLAAATTFPLWVASDSLTVIQKAVQLGLEEDPGNQPVSRIVVRYDGREPLHLDRGSDFLARKRPTGFVRYGYANETIPCGAAGYYDTFVDLLLLSKSRCVAYHVGGFGRLASLISSNYSCSVHHGQNQCLVQN